MDLITRADLQVFRIELLNDLKLLIDKEEKPATKPWLRNQDVCRLLGISSSTLKRLRMRGKVASTKVGGIHYYSFKEIENLLRSEK